MNILQIPAKLLQDSAVLLVPKEKEIFGDSYEEVALSNVRICFSKKVRLGNNNTVCTSAGTLYFDCRRSAPAGTVFAADMKLVIDGERYRIAEAKAVKAEKDVHHWEITFV